MLISAIIDDKGCRWLILERVNLTEDRLIGVIYSKITVFLDDEGKVILLPLLWLIHLYNTGSVYGWRAKARLGSREPYTSNRVRGNRYFDQRDVADNTIENYVGNVFRFLNFINNIHKTEGTPSVHNTELISTRLANHYLNSILPNSVQSYASLVAHQAAISAYLNFLHSFDIIDYLPSTIYRKTRQLVEEKSLRPGKINYVTRTERNHLLQACGTERDRLILRMGFEVGLRTSENKGLVLEDFKARRVMNSGLLTLFFKMEENSSILSFEYVLSGKYAKGGKTRNIYFSRELLTSMKRYYDNERFLLTKASRRKSNSFFLRTDNTGLGLPISECHGSNVFSKLLAKLHFINVALSYHDLRHTFATELYHMELLDAQGQETRSESAALIVVSERLGHKHVTTTHRYIRLRQQMLAVEESK